MPDLNLEKQHWSTGSRYVAGCDEAGRGCLAGPVVAAAVVLPQDANLPGLDDSKKLSPQKRDILYRLVYKESIATGIGSCSPKEIDQMNILHASLEAMRRAVLNLSINPDVLLIDGNQLLKNINVPQHAIIKGDSVSLSIAAASIIAKVTRDRLMVDLDAVFPMYGWASHKGYPTQTHYAALAKHGACRHHRQSFKLWK